MSWQNKIESKKEDASIKMMLDFISLNIRQSSDNVYTDCLNVNSLIICSQDKIVFF